jgi:hypothetical protein
VDASSTPDHMRERANLLIIKMGELVSVVVHMGSSCLAKIALSIHVTMPPGIRDVATRRTVASVMQKRAR